MNPWTKRGHPFYEPGRVMAGDSFVRFSDLRRTEFYNDFLRDVGVAHAFGACLFKRGEVRPNLAVTRSQAHGPFQEHELALARVLLPHMQQAIQIQERLGDLQAAYGASGRALDRLPRGVIIVNAHARLLFANRAAREIVVARDGLSIVGGGLEAEQVSDRLKLRVLIKRAIRSAAGNSLKAAGAMRVSRPSMKRPYLRARDPAEAGRRRGHGTRNGDDSRIGPRAGDSRQIRRPFKRRQPLVPRRRGLPERSRRANRWSGWPIDSA